MTKDLHIFENGNGGELAILNGDLVLAESLYQCIYISLFGGNKEASTLGNEIANQERFDYWGNSLIFENQKSKQFNSETQRILNNVTVNSLGRLKIKSAVEQDLYYLKKIANINVDVLLDDNDKIRINVTLKSKANQSDKEFQFIWDNAKQEIITNKSI